jgi:hypothetical protein
MGELSAEDTKALSEELALLTRKQSEALQKTPYARMSQEEAFRYDQRRQRIGRICVLLGKNPQ